MSPNQAIKWAMGAGAGIVTGVAAIIWLYGNFLTKTEHIAYVNSHKEWHLQSISSIQADLEEVKVDIKEIRRLLAAKGIGKFYTNNAEFLNGKLLPIKE